VKIRYVIPIKLNQLVKENVHSITIYLRNWCHNNKHFA